MSTIDNYNSYYYNSMDITVIANMITQDRNFGIKSDEKIRDFFERLRKSVSFRDVVNNPIIKKEIRFSFLLSFDFIEFVWISDGNNWRLNEEIGFIHNEEIERKLKIIFPKMIFFHDKTSFCTYTHAQCECTFNELVDMIRTIVFLNDSLENISLQKLEENITFGSSVVYTIKVGKEISKQFNYL